MTNASDARRNFMLWTSLIEEFLCRGARRVLGQKQRRQSMIQKESSCLLAEIVRGAILPVDHPVRIVTSKQRFTNPRCAETQIESTSIELEIIRRRLVDRP